MKITYQVESMLQCQGELEPFVPRHWAELGLDHQDVPVDMDWQKYQGLEDVGALHFVSVRDDGVLIGYHISTITTMLHYASTKHAVVDLYYLLPAYRKSKVGVELFKFAEKKFREMGVVKVINGTKLHLNHSALFEGLGFKATEVIYCKILGDAA